MRETSPALLISHTATRARRYRLALLGLAGLVPLAALVASGIGAYRISPWEIPAALAEGGRDAQVLWSIRFPRVALALLVGAAFGVAGAALQGLFRNPLADPGLLGVTAGAAAGAALWIVLVGAWLPSLRGQLGTWGLPVAAFVGSALCVSLVWRVAKQDGKLAVVTLLLAGIALNALVGAVVGLLTVVADDEQLRTLTFWLLGGLGHATWSTVLACGSPMLLGMLLVLRQSRALNAFALGESDAYHLGVRVEVVKRWLVLGVALCVGSAVAASGGIGFIGLVVPHMLRLAVGADHRFLLPAAALGGALLLVVADLMARTAAAPAELPVGVITALVGGPFFLCLLLKAKREVLHA